MNEITTPYPLNGSVYYLRYPVYEWARRANEVIPDPFIQNHNTVSYELVGSEYVPYFNHERPFSPLSTEYILDAILFNIVITAEMFYLASMPYTVHTEEWLIDYVERHFFTDIEDVYYGFLEYLAESGEFYFTDDEDSPYYRDHHGNIVEIKEPVLDYNECRFTAYIIYLMVQTIAGYYPNLVQQFYFHRDKHYHLHLEEVEETPRNNRHPKVKEITRWLRDTNRLSLIRMEVRCLTY